MNNNVVLMAKYTTEQDIKDYILADNFINQHFPYLNKNKITIMQLGKILRKFMKLYQNREH